MASLYQKPAYLRHDECSKRKPLIIRGAIIANVLGLMYLS